MLQFGLPLVPAGIASWVTASSDRVILQMFRGTSEVGLYSIAASLAGGVGLATGAFQMAFSPFAYSIIHEPVSKVVYSRVFSVYAWGSCLLGTTVSLFAPFLLRVLTTPMYYPASSSVPFLVFSLLAVGASYIAALGSGIAKKSVPVALYVFIAAGVSILLNLVLVRFLGRDGAAISALTANSVALVYLFTASQKYHHIPYGFRDALACFAFAALVVGLDRFLLRSWAPVEVAARIGACLLFIPLAFWLRIVRPDHVTRAFAWLAIRLSPQAKPAE
jgi:O-antigen/teichoic acid export membrane protein